MEMHTRPKETTRPATLDDVARAAGVSRAAASAVLNRSKGNMRVGDATRQRILECAGQLGYRPNPLAVALARRRTDTVSVVVRSLQTHVTAAMVSALLEYLGGQGIGALVQVTGKEPKALEKAVRRARCGMGEGLLLFADAEDAEHSEAVQELASEGYPCVLVGSQSGLPLASVAPDRATGACESARHLLRLGHRYLGFVGWPGPQTVLERLQGYEQALASAGLASSHLQVFSPDSMESIEQLGSRDLWQMKEHPSALLAQNDLVAMHLIKGVCRAGRQVPGELSVVGFGDQEVVALSAVPLTTIEYPVADIARQSAELLLCQIATYRAGQGVAKKHLRLPMRLVVRQSTGAVPNLPAWAEADCAKGDDATLT